MLRYWKPILDASLPTYTDEVERMFRDFFGGRGYPLAGEQRWVPPVDVHEVGDAVVVTMDLPAVDPKEIEVSVLGDKLVVQGERRCDKDLETPSCCHSERMYGGFQRVIDLPAEVSADDARAVYKNGVLRITMPKRAREMQKEIRIEVK
jgi:HSP20 family protein